ncbi:MAG: hypothetical protein LBQ87_09230, partial [Candidatus Fibromonas sp.]|nr:hypothetical protein [Candidatus Fibromonas sp.]
MRSKLLLILIALALFACSEDNNPVFPFERTVTNVSIAKRCKDGSFAPGANCYLMRWQHPTEKKDLQNYYIWLDTIPVKDSVQNISQEQINRANAIVNYVGCERCTGDSLDLTNLISGYLNRDSLHIAIFAKYAGNEQGVAQHIFVYFGDDIPPSIVNFNDSASANTIWIDWPRPTDQRDFYIPDAIDGPIAGYNVSIQAMDSQENIRNVTLRISLAGNNISDYRKFYRFRKQGRSVALEDFSTSDLSFLILAIPDGEGFKNDEQADKWKIEISGLKPEQSYKISIAALDSAGNASSMERNVATTDAIAPLMANKFWLYTDPSDSKARLDSNRLILFWPRSIDPLSNLTPSQQTQWESTSSIPAGLYYREVKSYSIEQRNGNSWEPIARVSRIPDNYYSYRYRLENNSMKLDYNGEYISDTLRWILPGETIALRIRAVDSSGHYSKAFEKTIEVSEGELGKYKCPADFAPVRKDSSSIFCMEKLEHASEDKFEKNVLYAEAKKSCEDLGFNLCTEQEWNAACNSRGFYGIIEEKDAVISDFLSRYCKVGTGDSLSAVDAGKRSKICSSPDGIRDLPGQLQEWVTGSDGNPLLKGSSYAKFQGASIVELAQCRNRITPTRIRPRGITDTVYLYRTGSRADTLLAPDTLRA